MKNHRYRHLQSGQTMGGLRGLLEDSAWLEIVHVFAPFAPLRETVCSVHFFLAPRRQEHEY